MAEKRKVPKILEELSEKYGYKLVKKESTNPKPELPETTKDYEEMDSKQLAVELKDVKSDITKLEAQNERLRERISNFMDEQQPEILNRSVFQGNKFDPAKLSVQNKELNLKSNLRKHIESLIKKATEDEMKQKFVSLNPEFEGVVKGMAIEPVPTGHMLVVKLGGSVDESDLNKMLEEDGKGKTTSKSAAGLGKK